MKTKFLTLIAFTILGLNGISNLKAHINSSSSLNDTMVIQCTPDLYNLTSNWVNAFMKSNPGVNIRILKTQGSDMSKEYLGFTSRDYLPEFNNSLTWKMVVGVDVIVPIINQKNPRIEEFQLNGITPKKLNELTSINSNGVKVYALKNESLKSRFSNFFEADKSSIKVIDVETSDELISIIRNEPLAIGFCMMSDIVNLKSNDFVNGIKPLPIDKNKNGKIDFNEKIYENAEALIHGVWIGKYPKELYQNIYSVSSTTPKDHNQIAFLTWVLSSGQQLMNSNGYCDLTNNQRQANIDKLYFKEVKTTSSSRSYIVPIAIILITVLVIIFFTIDSIVSRLRNKRLEVSNTNFEATPFFDEKSIAILDGLYFDKSHTWVFMEKDGTVGVGLDDFLQHITGPISKIKMRESGENVKKGEPFLTIIQDGKQLNIKAPISGTIKARNIELESDTSILAKSPYQDGWIYMIEPSNWFRDIQFLIMSQGYKEWIKMEFLHLKDFLAIVLKGEQTEGYQVVMQDGGEIKNGILKDMKPEVWEDFQTHFLDSVR